MIRRVAAWLMLFTAGALFLSACDSLGRPTLNPAFGARDVDGQLHIWTGSTCHQVTELSLTFDPNQEDRVEFGMRATGETGVDVDHFTVGESIPGLAVTQPLPIDFDWRRTESMRISVTSADGGWGTTTQLTEVREASAEHPSDTYWFQGVGWLNPAEVSEQDGKTFLATCTSKPTN